MSQAMPRRSTRAGGIPSRQATHNAPMAPAHDTNQTDVLLTSAATG